MKVFVVLSALMACAVGQFAYPYAFSPFGHSHYVQPYTAYPYNAIHAHVPVALPTSTQYRAQDVFGQFTFGTAGDNQARVETKTVDGTVTGAYSYIDPTGKNVNVNYLADHNGFRVLGANNLPEAPAPLAIKGPEPVQDTPEVMAARAAFEKKFAEAKAAAASSPETMSRRKRQAVFYNAFVAPTPVFAKSTLKYNTFETVDAAVPADTKKAELKEKEIEVTHPIAHVAPLAYSAVVPSPYVYHL